MAALTRTVRRLSGEHATLVDVPGDGEGNPAGIPDERLVAWYAARHTSATDGQQLSTIPEVSGLGANDLFQNNVARRARWFDNVVNGLATFRFDGTDWYRAAWNQTVPQPYQVFIVLNTRTPFGLDDDEVYFSGFSSDASDKHLFAIIDHVIPSVNQPVTPPDWMIENAGNNQHVVGGLPVNDTWYVVRIDFESTGVIVVNGTVIASGGSGTLSSTGITFGAREDGNRGTTGDIAELIFCRDLSVLQKAAIEDELMTIYGVTP